MAKIVNNRQVNVWRGIAEPPTIHHLWIKDEATIFIYDDDENKWVLLNEFPGITFEPDTETGTVIIRSGKSSFRLAVEGASLGIHTNVADTITIKSDALVNIDTESPLYWNPTAKKLTHEPSSVITDDQTKQVTYGPTADMLNSDSFFVPEITVDKYGHVQKGATHQVTVPGKVTQNVLRNTLGTFPVILAPSDATETKTEETYKTPVLQVEAAQNGQEVNYTLIAPNIQVEGEQSISGNLTVRGVIRGNIEGNVNGTATPVNHADVSPRFGLGTAAPAGEDALYGHVKLQDVFDKDVSGVIVEPQSTAGVAASPLLVYNALQEVAKIEDNYGHTSKLATPFTFSNDFTESQNKIYINWLEIQ